MGFLGFGKKDDVIDLTEKYKRDQEKLAEREAEQAETTSSGSSGGFGFLGGLAGAGNSEPANDSSEGYADLGDGVDEKRKRLAKRIMEMTTKIEDLNNQVYHLQQRIEVLERKNGVSR